MRRKLWKTLSFLISLMMLFSSVNITAFAQGITGEGIEEESTFEEDSEASETDSEEVSEMESEENSEVDSEIVSEESSEVLSEEISEEVSEETSEEVSEELSEESSEEISEDSSEVNDVVPAEEQELNNLAFSDDDIAHGTYENVTWVIDKDGKLIVTGTGNYKDEDTYEAPWIDYASQIKTAEIKISNCKDASFMFAECENLISVDFSGFDTSNITTMRRMFRNCYNLKNVDFSNFDTADVTTMEQMFFECRNLTKVDLSSFDTSSVRVMIDMFFGCESLTELDLSSFDTSNVTSMRQMFVGCYELTELNISSFRTPNLIEMEQMFNSCDKLTELDLSNFDLNNLERISDLFSNNANLVKIKTPINLKLDCSLPNKSTWVRKDINRVVVSLPIGLKESIELVRTDNIFSDDDIAHGSYENIRWSIDKNGNLLVIGNGEYKEVDSSNSPWSNYLSQIKSAQINLFECEDTSYMFAGCKKITEIDLSNLNASKVSNMSAMFDGCDSLITIYAPINVTIDCDLPQNGTWIRTDTNEVVKYLPKNLNKSIELVNKDKVVDTEIYSNIYELDGGINHAENPTSYTKGETVTFKAPTKEGYKFAGWYDKSNNRRVISVTGKNITVYAKWIPIYYRITFQLRGGTFARGTVRPAKYFIDSENITLPTPIRKYYNFKGWYEDTFFTRPVTEISTRSTGNKVFYAKWEGIHYNLILHKNFEGSDITENMDCEYNVTYKMEDTLFETLAEDGYVIDSWNTKPDGKGKKYTSIKNLGTLEGQNVELYAQWKKLYYITYDLDHGNDTLNLSEYIEGSTYTFKKPVRDGYTFAGWYEVVWDDESKTEVLGKKVSSVKNKDIKVKATWKVNTYKISFKTNSGKFEKGTILPKTFTIESEAVSLPTPVRDYYHFAGWYYDKKFTMPADSEIPAGSFGNKTLYAKWIGQEYSITYQCPKSLIAPGSEEVDVQTVAYNYGTKYKLANADIPGYYVSKWSAEINGKKKIFAANATFSNLTKVEHEAIVLTAVEVKPITYTIRYNANGGRGTNPSSQTVRGLDKVTLKESKYKKSGYVQKGWIDENGNVYECGQEVSELTYLNRGIVILKANWVEVEE